MTQINLLNDEINELIRKRDELEARLQAANSAPEQNAIQHNLDGLNKTIGEKQTKLSEQEKIEEKVNAADVPFTISGVDLGLIPPQVMEVIDAIVKADRRLRLAEHAIELEQLEAEAKTQIEKLMESTNAELNAIQSQISTISAEQVELEAEMAKIAENRDNLRDKVLELEMINGDLTSKLRNAATQIEEKDKEIARLNDQIDDYQKAKVFGERQAQSIIDVTPNEAEEINGKIKKLFTTFEDWGSVLKAYKPDGNFEVVKREEFNSEWVPEVPTYNGGSESTGSFPGEAVEADATDCGFPTPQAPSLDFPTQEETTTVPEHTVDGEMDATSVTRAELAELEARVYRLEQQAKGVAA